MYIFTLFAGRKFDRKSKSDNTIHERNTNQISLKLHFTNLGKPKMTDIMDELMPCKDTVFRYTIMPVRE